MCKIILPASFLEDYAKAAQTYFPRLFRYTFTH